MTLDLIFIFCERTFYIKDIKVQKYDIGLLKT